MLADISSDKIVEAVAEAYKQEDPVAYQEFVDHEVVGGFWKKKFRKIFGKKIFQIFPSQNPPFPHKPTKSQISWPDP